MIHQFMTVGILRSRNVSQQSVGLFIFSDMYTKIVCVCFQYPCNYEIFKYTAVYNVTIGLTDLPALWILGRTYGLGIVGFEPCNLYQGRYSKIVTFTSNCFYLLI